MAGLGRRGLKDAGQWTEDELVGSHLCPAPPVLRICSKEGDSDYGGRGSLPALKFSGSKTKEGGAPESKRWPGSKTGSEVEEPDHHGAQKQEGWKTRWYVRGHSSQPGGCSQARDEMSWAAARLRLIETNHRQAKQVLLVITRPEMRPGDEGDRTPNCRSISARVSEGAQQTLGPPNCTGMSEAELLLLGVMTPSLCF